MSRSGKPLEGLTLLVIEDEQDTRELITFMLQLAGATVTTVIHIYEALEVLDRLTPDALLSNIHLPDGDGYMMIEFWRDKEAALGIKPVPAIILVDSEREVSRKRIHQAGFQTYLSKSFELNEVVEAVARVILQAKSGKRKH